MADSYTVWFERIGRVIGVKFFEFMPVGVKMLWQHPLVFACKFIDRTLGDGIGAIPIHRLTCCFKSCGESLYRMHVGIYAAIGI